MKIKNLKLKNFANFQDFEIEFNGDITRLVGINGSGKTTIGLTAIWAGLKGISENNKNGQLIGERFRFIGSQKPTADIEIQVYDEKIGDTITITNHITKESNKITCTPVQDADWLNKFLSVAFLSAQNFCQLSGKEQALLLGIDTAKFDAELKALKEEFTLINRDYRNIGELPEIAKVERIDTSQLASKKVEIRNKLNEIYLQNKAKNDQLRNEYQLKIEEERDRKRKLENDNNLKEFTIAEAKENLQNLVLLGYKGNEVLKWIDSLPQPTEYKPVTIPEPEFITPEVPDDSELREIDSQILTASETNEQAAKYEQYLKNLQNKNQIKLKLEKNQADQKEKEIERLNYIKSFKFGFSDLTINEDGGLLLQNKPIKDPYFSKGELELIVAKLYASLHPELKMRFVDNFELLDEDNQVKIIDSLLSDGFQIITAEVGKIAKYENTILLRECKVVEKYEQQQKLF